MAAAVIHGLNSINTNRHDIARALIEGIVVGLAQGMNRLVELGIEPKNCVLPVAEPKVRLCAKSCLTSSGYQ